MNKIRLCCTFLMVMVTLAVNAGHSWAQVVPFKSTGVNNLYDPVSMVFGGEGQTAHMGRSSGLGIAVPSPTDDPLTLNWSGAGEFEAANGDKIFFSGGGQVYLTPLGGTMFTAAWIGEFNIEGGTGRFANVGPGTAPLSVVAINHPFDIVNDPIWAYDYEITGDMDLGKKGKKK